MQKEQVLTDLEEKDNILEFKAPQRRLALSTGGGPPNDENWLANLEVGSVFLARPKQKTGQQTDPVQRLILNVYFLQDRKTLSSNLIWKMPDDKQISIWTPNLEFSRTMEFIEVLTVLTFGTEEISEGNKDGNTEGPV